MPDYCQSPGRGWVHKRADPACTFSLCWDEPDSLSLCFAPKGVDADREEETLLGMFTYNTEKDPIQTFPLKVCSTHGGQMPGSKSGLIANPWQGGCECFLPGQRVLDHGRKRPGGAWRAEQHVVVVAKGQGQARGNTAPERSLTAATAFRKARQTCSQSTQTTNEPCATEGQGKVVAKAVRHHCCSTLCPADTGRCGPTTGGPFFPGALSLPGERQAERMAGAQWGDTPAPRTGAPPQPLCQHRARGRGKGDAAPAGPACGGCRVPSLVRSLPSSPGTSSELQISIPSPTYFWELVPEQKQGWQGKTS